MSLLRRLQQSLHGIIADASRATPADDRAIENERPLFEHILDPDLRSRSQSKYPNNGWPKGKKRGTQ